MVRFLFRTLFITAAFVATPTSLAKDLSPTKPPSKNFKLKGWTLTLPTDLDKNGKADLIKEKYLSKDFEAKPFFYTGGDGGMVFASPIKGAKTSKNTSYTRSELREMLRKGNTDIKTKNKDGTPNKNNWVFSTAPERTQKTAGGVDGVMEATLAVNRVTTTGSDNQVGRVIIGQIHAKDDEPIRLYYRKLPGNENGAIYAAHESKSVPDDIYYDIIGSRSKSAANPENGIALNEKFSYKIDAKGHTLDVTIYNAADDIIGETSIDMTNSGYDVPDDYMYFKAGVYNQNKSGDPTDYVQATFYKLDVSHDKYRKKK
ncbi:MAG: polysaccharide lyase family 7 protein [Maricaulaceae bacterium]